jgi:aldose 1-epimerase
VTELSADAESAWVTSRLEFFKYPELMQQFPFAHTLEITHTLHDGILQVAISMHNLSSEAMPVAIGFHPYFQLTDSPRDQWTVSVGARTRWLLAPTKIPTGETEPIEKFFPDPRHAVLGTYDVDDVFSDLIRDETGRAVMTVKGRHQHIDLVLGPNYRAMVMYAPKPSTTETGSQTARSRNFVCFEPMAGITDAMNLAHDGLYKELQSIQPGGTWTESFWIQPKRF